MSFSTRILTSAAILSLTSIAFSTKAIAVEGSWQLGVNAGLSRLSPDTDGSGFTLEDDQSTAASFYIGFDVMPIISAELAFTSLGEASLSDNQSIEYQAISLGAIAYIWGEKEAQIRSSGASGYARLGLSVINNESEIALDESDNIALWLGLGVQYPFSDNWGMRAEITSFDGDAQAVMAGVFWRTGTSSRADEETLANDVLQPDRPAEPVAPAPTVPAEPTVSETPQIAERLGREPTRPVEPVTSESTRPAEPPGSDAPGAEVASGASVCPPAVAAKVRDQQDCAVLNGVVPELDFVIDTAKLTASATAPLDRIIAALQDNPAVVLEIRAHVQSLARPQGQAQLSSLRARAVARYLVENGVPVSRLRAKAFGATQPIADTATAAGALMNNRIEVRVL